MWQKLELFYLMSVDGCFLLILQKFIYIPKY